MKIVSTSYINTPEYTDPEKWLERISFYTGLLEELAKHYEVESIEQINYSGTLKKKGVTYNFLNFRKHKLYFPFTLHSYIKKLGPDVVFVHGLIFPFQVVQLRLILGRRVKILVLHRSEKPFIGLKKWLQRLADRSIDGYLFASSGLAEAWRSNLKVRKVFEIIQVSSIFHPEDKKLAVDNLKITGKPIFLWVGSLIPRKDPLTVVKAFLQFTRYENNARLYMIYQSNKLLPEIIKSIAANDLVKDNIVLVGEVDHKSLQSWYNAADFFILGSHHEGGSIAISEAMSCGCIPIVTKIPSSRTMTGNSGLLYEAGNETDLLTALRKTKELNLEDERRKVLKQFNNELSFEAISKKIDTAITLICKK